MIPLEVLGRLRPIPEDCSFGAAIVTCPSDARVRAAAHNPGERIPSSLVKSICVVFIDVIIKEAGNPASVMAPSARLEHATYCSASKRSNPLSYEGISELGF